MRLNKILAGIGTLALTSVAVADWQPIDLAKFSHGQVLDRATTGPATLHALNFHNADSRLVAFDTRHRGTRDPDIEGPNGEDGTWAAGNLNADDVLGTVLIIQSIDDAFAGYTDADRTAVVQPDDEERHRDGVQPGAGEITLKLDREVSAVRFTLIDVEQTEAFENQTASYVVFACGEKQVTVAFAEFIDADSAFYDPSIRFGDHSANRLPAVTAAELGLPWIDQVVINLGGSGAVGGLSYLEDPNANIGFALVLANDYGFGTDPPSGAWFSVGQGEPYTYGSPGPGGNPPGPSPKPQPPGPGGDPPPPPGVPSPGAGLAGALLISMLVARRPRKNASRNNA